MPGEEPRSSGADAVSTLARAQALVDRDARKRRAAAVSFVNLDNALAGVIHPGDGIVDTLDRALRDPDRTVAWAAARLLRHSGDADALERLRLASSDPRPAVRRWATLALAMAEHAEPQTYDALRRALGDPDPSVARRAASALANVGDIAAAEALIGACRRSPELHGVLCIGLAKLAKQHADRLLEALHDDDAAVRSAAAYALRGGTPGTAVCALATLLDEADTEVRRNAADSIAKLAQADASATTIEALIRSSRNSDPKVRLVGVETLASITTAPAPTRTPPSAAATLPGIDRATLLSASARDPDADVRLVGVKALMRIVEGPALTELLRQAATDPDPRIRRTALLAASPRALPELLELALAGTHDPSPAVREAAYEALLKISPDKPGVVEAAVRAIDDRDAGAWTTGITILGRIGSDDASQALIRVMFGGEHSVVRCAAIAALPLNSHRNVGAMAQALAHPDGDVARAAATALGRGGGATGLDVLMDALSHPNRRVSAAAALGLSALPEKHRDRLVQALTDHRAPVRAALLCVLAQQKGEHVRPTVEMFLRDPAPAVRLAAKKVLAQFDWEEESRRRERAEGAAGFRMEIPGDPLSAYLGAFTRRVAGRELATQPRYLNTWLSDSDGAAPLPTDEPLTPGRQYVLCTKIGAALLSNAVTNALQHPFPDHVAGDGTATLDVHVLSDEFEIAEQFSRMDLPREGASETVAIGVRAPAAEGNASIRLLVFHKNNCVMSQLLRACVGGRGRGYQVMIDYVLTADSSQLGSLDRQALALHCAAGPAGELRLAVRGDGHDMYTASLSDLKVRNAANVARYALLDIHFGPENGRSRYDRRNVRSPARCRDDLELLARRGWMLYQNTIDHPVRRSEFRQLLRTTSVTTAKPAAVQIVVAGREMVSFPWQLVYDIPITSQATSLSVCPTLTDWLTGDDDEIPAVCPYDHTRNVLCPFGFWGYAYEVAAPLSSVEGSQPVVVGRTAASPTALAAISDELDRCLSADHLARLRRTMPFVESRNAEDLERSLSDSPVDILYFYCHGKRQPVPGGAQQPLLEIGVADRISPEDILAWADGWPPVQWVDPQPLVVMNGCHTSELTPELLTDFVSAFAELNASGAIGTEIAVTQRVASEVFEWLAQALVDGHGVAAAIRQMRWHMLRKGNVMGLAYTPYCYGGLRLRDSANGW